MRALVEGENVSWWFAIQPQSQAVCTAIGPRFHINRRFNVSRCVTADSGHAGNASDRPLLEFTARIEQTAFLSASLEEAECFITPV